MQESPIKRQKRKKKSGLGYLILFALVFILALFGLSYLVKSFSPDVDVSIGNTESLTLNDTDTDVKTVDERLKWIQMEDELPTVAIRTSKDDNTKQFEKIKEGRMMDEKDFYQRPTPTQEERNILLKPTETVKPKVQEIPQQKVEVKVQPVKKTEPDAIEIKTIKLSKPSKVYVGQYSSVEEAVKTQNKLASEESDIIPFIKKVNGYYVVQAGSFSDKDKAISLTSRLNSKGYKARSISE